MLAQFEFAIPSLARDPPQASRVQRGITGFLVSSLVFTRDKPRNELNYYLPDPAFWIRINIL